MNLEFNERELSALRTMTLFDYCEISEPLDSPRAKVKWELHLKIKDAHEESLKQKTLNS